MLDLRNPENHPELLNTLDAIRNIGIPRATANHLRSELKAQAMLVPLIASLVDLTRWNLVIFLDKMPAFTWSWITNVERIGPLAWPRD